MVMCARCRKRMAVVFITRVENGESKQEGICIKCARELGIKPVNDIIDKMGLSDEDVDRMSEEMQDIMDGVENGDDPLGLGALTSIEGSGDESDAPAVDLARIMREGLANSEGGAGRKNKKEEKDEKAQAHRKKETKFLSAYCQNINEKALMGKLDNIVGRERELDRIIQILCRRQKNNPCLIG